MYLCYVDESGHCGTEFNAAQPAEVVAGVVINAYKLNKTQREQRELIRLLKASGINIDELKASAIYRGRDAWEQVPPEARAAVFAFLFDWMNERNCKITVCPIDSGVFFAKRAQANREAKRFQHPYEAGAFNVVLSIQREHKDQKRNKGNTIVIMDEQPEQEANLLSLFEQDLSFTDGYTCHTQTPSAERLSQIIDVPHFSRSHLAIPIQLADNVAFVVRRHIELTCYGDSPRYAAEEQVIAEYYAQVGKCLIRHRSINPPGNDSLSKFYREVRPAGWSAKDCRA